MIVFEKIRWKNFLSTGNVFSEVDLEAGRTNLIVGTNGAGKSTILDALTFSLFGKPFRKINKPALVNSINEKDCLVEIEFRIGKMDTKLSVVSNQTSLRSTVTVNCGTKKVPCQNSKRTLRRTSSR